MEWQMIGAFLAIMTTWSAGQIWVFRFFLNQVVQNLDERLKNIQPQLLEIQRLDKELVLLKTQLVHREDWIRTVTILESKIDQLQMNFCQKVDELRRQVHE